VEGQDSDPSRGEGPTESSQRESGPTCEFEEERGNLEKKRLDACALEIFPGGKTSKAGEEKV